MIAALLLAGAIPMTAIEAEHAFAADAQKLGQWTAFRKWAAFDATMFVPRPVKAHTWLKDRANPPRSVAWKPTASFVSCDGRTAVNTGNWQRPDGSVGYFTTVWHRQADGQWRWAMDHGDALDAARPSIANPLLRVAACRPNGRPPFPVYRHAGINGRGRSADGSLQFYWRINAMNMLLPRTFHLGFWNGKGWELPITDVPRAPK